MFLEGWKYILVGVVIYAFDLLLYSSFVMMDSGLFVAGNIVGRLGGAVLGFVLHRNWTFKTSYKHNMTNQFIRYVLLLILNILLSTSLLFLLVDSAMLNEFMARFTTDFCIVVFTYVVSKFFVFKAERL